MNQMTHRQQATGDREQCGVEPRMERSVPAPCSLIPDPSSSGFTLIEAGVAVSMFVILLGAIMGIFTTFTRQQRSGIAQATLLGEAQSAVELLEREVRTGFSDTFRSSGPANFSFVNQEGNPITYQRDGTRITRQGVPITSSVVEVRSLEFVVLAASVDPGVPRILTTQQGRVTVRMRICPKGIDDNRCLPLQTTLTSRQYAPFLP